MTKPVLPGGDDPFLHRGPAFRLERAGYRASTAAGAEEALATAVQLAPPLNELLRTSLRQLGAKMGAWQSGDRCTRPWVPAFAVSSRRWRGCPNGWRG